MCVYESYISHTGMRTQLDTYPRSVNPEEKKNRKGYIHDVHELQHEKSAFNRVTSTRRMEMLTIR
jgi:hypothetical protein